MSKLASELPKVDFGDAPRRGPRGACYPVYLGCDQEDYEAVKKLKDKGLAWEQIQVEVDRLLGVEDPIDNKKFVYHWRKNCKCWRDV